MSAHTPGPWIVAPSAENGISAIKAVDPKDGLRFELCEVWGEDFDKEETTTSRANARLIAAAPDLLAALLLIRDSGRITAMQAGLAHEHKAMNDAIAKATGV